MPLVEPSSYRRVPYLFTAHLETIIPSLVRRIRDVNYQRQRLELPDGDFVDLDWLVRDPSMRNKLVIISHGLEGNSSRHYSLGMARYFFKLGWDALAWNCRSCSGELNRLPRFYHHGDTMDLSTVIDEATNTGYKKIALTGFSMGGSFSLKYLGEKGVEVPKEVVGAVCFSVPCDLAAGGRILDKPHLAFYRRRFLGKIVRKFEAKAIQFPGQFDLQRLRSVTDFEEFNEYFTAPLHGFTGAADFYARASCSPVLNRIAIPSLLVNAANDPLLTPECYPIEIAKASKSLYLEIPRHGGHVGFPIHASANNWMETRAFEFLTDL